jgi:prepilin signal peptidase PulO-like enzyme (type II secretory pathway)
LVAYLAAALFVIVLKVIGTTAARTAMPFAPFMAGGALFAVLVLR